jgi:plastocyanin
MMRQRPTKFLMIASMNIRRSIFTAISLVLMLSLGACSRRDSTPMPPGSPTPLPAPTVTANAYILPDATKLGPLAFGDEPVVIYKGERLRWRNFDAATHALVADSAGVPDFQSTNVLAPGDEQTFTMATPGSTTFHCTIHPNMVGTLIVAER